MFRVDASSIARSTEVVVWAHSTLVAVAIDGALTAVTHHPRVESFVDASTTRWLTADINTENAIVHKAQSLSQLIIRGECNVIVVTV